MNKKTATGAAMRKPYQEICKVRVQSTPDEIDHFHEFLKRCEKLGLCDVINFSDSFANKGTMKYYRAYTDIVVKEEGKDE